VEESGDDEKSAWLTLSRFAACGAVGEKW